MKDNKELKVILEHIIDKNNIYDQIIYENFVTNSLSYLKKIMSPNKTDINTINKNQKNNLEIENNLLIGKPISELHEKIENDLQKFGFKSDKINLKIKLTNLQKMINYIQKSENIKKMDNQQKYLFIVSLLTKSFMKELKSIIQDEYNVPNNDTYIIEGIGRTKSNVLSVINKLSMTARLGILIITAASSIFAFSFGSEISADISNIPQKVKDGVGAMFGTASVPEDVTDLVDAKITDIGSKIENKEAELEKIPGVPEASVKGTSFSSQLTKLQNDLKDSTLDAVKKAKIEADIEILQKEIEKNDKIIENLQKTTKTEISKLKNKQKTISSIKEILTKDTSAFAETELQKAKDAIKTDFLTFLKKQFDSNKTFLDELNSDRYYDFDSGKTGLNNEKNRKLKINELEKNNEIIGAYGQKIKSIADGTDSEFNKIMTPKEVRACYVMMKIYEDNKDYINCLDVVDDSGNYRNSDTVIKSIKFNPKVMEGYNEFLIKVKRGGIVNIINDLKKQTAGLTDNEKKMYLNRLDTVANNFANMDEEKLQANLDFFTITYLIAEKDVKAVDSMMAQSKEMNDAKNYFTDNFYSLKVTINDKGGFEVSRKFGVGMFKKANPKTSLSDKEIGDVLKAVVNEKGSAFGQKYAEANKKEGTLGFGGKEYKPTITLVESSSRKWDSLLSVIEENYFKRS